MIELDGGGPSRASGGMPMLDIKCQSLQPDAGWGCSVILHDEDTNGGSSAARTPQGSFCGDNTSLIESRIGELTSRFWVKAGTLARKKRTSSRKRMNYRGTN